MVMSGDSVKDKLSAQLSPEEALRRERMRMFVKGIASYKWVYRKAPGCESGDVHQCVVFPAGDQLLEYDVCTGTTHVVYDGHLGGSMIDPKVSPDGELVAFVCKNDVYVIRMPPLDGDSGGAM
jgi:Tol biopolymer transport system component